MSAPGKTGTKYKHSDQERDNNSHDDTWGVNVVEIVGENAGGTALNRLKVGDDGAVPSSAPIYKKQIDDTTTANVTYIGEAPLGTADGTASWRIKKIDESSGVVITWTGTGFDATWDDRTTEDYS